jgi:DNA-binding transcriptional LysR family regulator
VRAVTTNRLSSIDLNLLVALGALLEERNVTHAGNRIGISQPAMSGMLARLRAHFGDDLLRRTGRMYELTPMAEDLLPTVRQALESVGEVLRPNAAFDPAASSRRFTVSISDYAMTVLVAPLLTELAERAPDVTVDFRPLPPPEDDMITELMRRDVIVSALGFDIPGRRQVLFADRFVCVVSRHNSLLRDGALTLADLGKLGHAVGSFGEGAVTPADRLLTELGLERHVEVTVHGLLPLGFAVAGTELCAFVPERLARRYCELLDVVIAEVPFAPAKLVEAAHWHPTRQADQGLAFFREVLVDVAGRIGPSVT